MNHLQFSILLITTLLLYSSATAIVDPTPAPAPVQVSPVASPLPSVLGCDKKCAKRCANAGYNERCMKYCGICCGKCNGCVPSSPYADKAECPCYRDLKNSKGKDKCP